MAKRLTKRAGILSRVGGRRCGWWCASHLMAVLLAASQATVYGADRQTTPTRIVGLQYPRLAHLAGIDGRVKVMARIDRDGNPNQIVVQQGSPLLSEAAVDTLSKWHFSPFSDGPTTRDVEITFIFVLKGDPCDIQSCPTELQIDLPDQVTVTSRPARAIVN